MSDERIILATETQKPPDAGTQESIRRTRRHQAFVADLVTQHGGEILVHVGQGCVASLPSPEVTLEVVTALMAHRSTERGAFTRVRAALHLGPFDPEATTIAEPTVSEARQLLELAGPTEVVASAALRDTLAASHVQAAPISAWGDLREAPPTAYRLLLNPLARSASADRRPIPGWHIAGAVALGSASILAAIVVALLL